MNPTDINVGDRVVVREGYFNGTASFFAGSEGVVTRIDRDKSPTMFHVDLGTSTGPDVRVARRVERVAPAVKVGDKVTIEDVGIYGCADLLVGKNATVTEVINDYNWWGTRVPGVTYVVRPEGTSYSGVARCVEVEKVEPLADWERELLDAAAPTPAPKTGTSLGTATITIVPEIDEAALAQIVERIREATGVPAEPSLAEAKAATDEGFYLDDLTVKRDDHEDDDVVYISSDSIYLTSDDVDRFITFLRNCQRVHAAKTAPTPF